MKPSPPLRTGLLLTAAVAALAWLRPAAPAPGPVTLINTLPETISSPGTYCVTANLTGVADEHGIFIDSDDVVLDLGGHVLEGVTDSLTGVYAPQARNVRVVNGTLRDWGEDGVRLGPTGVAERLRAVSNEQNGIRVSDYSRVSDCTVASNSEAGILVTTNGIVRDCTVIAQELGVLVGSGALAERVTVMGGGRAFQANGGSRLVGCSARDFFDVGFDCESAVGLEGCSTLVSIPSGAPGIAVSGGDHMAISNCILREGVATGIRVGAQARITDTTVTEILQNGIEVGPFSRVTDCVVQAAGAGVLGDRGTHVADCTVRGGTEGITVVDQPYASVVENLVFGGADEGIRVADDALVRGNLAAENGCGIGVVGDRGRIDGNTLSNNHAGLSIFGAKNLVTGNRAIGSAGADFAIPFPNTFGPTLNTSWALQGSVPHANFRTPFP